MNERQRALLKLAYTKPGHVLECWDVAGNGTPPPYRELPKVETRARDDADVRELRAMGLLQAVVNTTRDPPIWWRLTGAGAVLARMEG